MLGLPRLSTFILKSSIMSRPTILFLISNLESGGVSKSMVSLLNTIDRRHYNVSLWIGNPTGLFYDMLPKDIIQITDSRISWLLNGLNGILPLLSHGHILLAMGNLFRMFVSCFNKGLAGWILSRLMPVITKQEYDLIVDYNGQHQLYYMIDRLCGKKKATFFHSDYSKWPYYYKVDRKYFPKTDRIFTISDTCVNALMDYFPEERRKICLMENISSIRLIKELANVTIDDFQGDIRLLTVGHVCHNKGSDLAIEAANILKKKGISFKWYFIGNIDENFQTLIDSLDIGDRITFLGLKANPYPYLRQATIYVHPSLFEGKSIALDEAKILCKPIVVTDFTTVNDQFEDRVNASICKMTPEDIADSIHELLLDDTLRNSYVQYLMEHIIDNSGEVDKLYHLLES